MVIPNKIQIVPVCIFWRILVQFFVITQQILVHFLSPVQVSSSNMDAEQSMPGSHRRSLLKSCLKVLDIFLVAVLTLEYNISHILNKLLVARFQNLLVVLPHLIQYIPPEQAETAAIQQNQ